MKKIHSMARPLSKRLKSEPNSLWRYC